MLLCIPLQESSIVASRLYCPRDLEKEQAPSQRELFETNSQKGDGCESEGKIHEYEADHSSRCNDCTGTSVVERFWNVDLGRLGRRGDSRGSRFGGAHCRVQLFSYMEQFRRI